ncbi:DUF4412 domain-containing protein [Panacibacter sp. DH6]|uniref:DUF4412 domain-containing protein n=1 Tax=Panacibacter microcysteis TaxID=2793269 RepID=A0A931GWU8_9BACT|nr:DUF4412 domain-containing protein [Panacibacter microcysteis]MBG9376828.1 DUF4412 domain-containing protein [Panacibacter microcysteis]
MKTMRLTGTKSVGLALLTGVFFFFTPEAALQAQDVTKFNFKTGITYSISEGAKKAGNKLTMWFSDGDYAAMEPAENNMVLMIFDTKNTKMLTIMQAQKMVMTMDFGKFQQQYKDKKTGEDQPSAPKGQVTKTGVSEKIMGYNCDQYKITSAESESLVWVTTELDAGYINFAKSMMMAMNSGKGKTGNNALGNLQDIANGVMLKMITKDLSNNKEVMLEATNVNTSGKEVDITGYQTMKISGQ